MVLTVGSLFAGIGGFDLGLERTGGFEVKWQVEIDPYCQRVLAKHWPHVQRYGDIRTVTNVELVDVLCGGFPCQDISNAGKRVGIDGERSGLWSEYARLIRLVRPRYVIVENVAALLGRGMGRVLGDLAESGYHAEWDCIRAADIGAPHIRERVWIVAHARRGFPQESSDTDALHSGRSSAVGSADTTSRSGGHGGAWHVAYTEPSERMAQPQRRHVFNGNDGRGKEAAGGLSAFREDAGRRQWSVEPDVGRVAHGIPARVDRLKGLGNAIVPQIAEWIGMRILEAEQRREAELSGNTNHTPLGHKT